MAMAPSPLGHDEGVLPPAAVNLTETTDRLALGSLAQGSRQAPPGSIGSAVLIHSGSAAPLHTYEG